VGGIGPVLRCRTAASSSSPVERENGTVATSICSVGKPEVVRITSQMFVSLLAHMGARIMEFDKLLGVIGNYQQLDFAEGVIELPLRCADALDADGLGKVCWQTAMIARILKTI
jgi:hypothetical protein